MRDPARIEADIRAGLVAQWFGYLLAVRVSVVSIGNSERLTVPYNRADCCVVSSALTVHSASPLTRDRSDKVRDQIR